MAERAPARRRSRAAMAAGASGLESWSHGPNNARGRIARGLVVPQGHPGFRLSPEATVFQIGPGFARQLDTALTAKGVRVTSRDPASPLPEVRENPRLGLLDKLNPVSIQQELDWAAGQPFPREVLMPAGDTYADPCLHERAAHGGIAGLLERRAEIGRHFAGAFRADLVVVTLEQIETWFDRRTKIALNNAPLQRIYDQEPDRFSLRRLPVSEIGANLKRICARLRSENPRQKVVLAVSPVPIERTFGQEDVIVANLAAKSALHAAATECALATEGVDYFPCYEAVTTSDPGKVWHPDRRTVRDEMVSALAEAFVERYGLYLSAESKTAGSA